jgi:N-acetylglucosamine-6-phosphate deacetylase
MIIRAKNALIGGEIIDDALIHIQSGYITKIEVDSKVNANQEITGTLIPGFVDTHCHGGGGFSFSSDSESEVEHVIETHRTHGTTTQFASLVSEPLDILETQITRLREFVMAGKIAGIHLEGPYLSPQKCGAHDPLLLRNPVLSEISALIAVGQGTIAMMTIAPELPGAIKAIELLVNSGVVAALGHSNANYEVAQAAIAAGATVITHFYNALPPLDHREPTITSAALLSDALNLELILDGHHVNAPAVDILLRSAPQRIMLVTDAMSAAGSTDGEYRIGELPVIVKDGQARLISNNSLAGSTLTMDLAFNRLMGAHRYSLADASFATSTLPALVHGLSEVGEIAVGRKANFVEITGTTFQRVLTF